MIERKHYQFQPDYRNIVAAATNQAAPRLPLYEHIFGGDIMKACIGKNPYDLMYSENMEESKEGFRQYWEFFREMGYDTASMEFGVLKVLVGGGALEAHGEGSIKDRDDFENYPWDELPDRYFDYYAPYIRNFAEACLPGMKAIGGVGNGPFEVLQDLVGYLDLCYIKGDDEDLYYELFEKMGEVYSRIWERFIREFGDVFCVFRFGDDLGYKCQTLISPDDIRAGIIPTYKKIVDMAHAAGKPFLLHSCGCIFDVMDDLIDTAGINAKHSNEDQIAPYTEWVNRYGHRIGNFGGLDTGVLCTESPETIRKMAFECLEKIQGHGGLAFSSGNSIPDYVPVEGYLAMNEAVRDWRGDQQI
ncbi:MAG: hypothetical protein E7324_08945 [Clostridiales bacterium]|nr:hypothetical protein [Clostridiales bacterium]